ncbi:hypothetical protein ACFLT8_01295 [Chloroflexota bacterium]
MFQNGSTLHDFPYSSPKRKCPYFLITNVTPPRSAHCIHNCLYCYAREAIYSDFSPDMVVYSNLPQLLETDLKCIYLAPPISIFNVTDSCQDVPELKTIVKELIRLIMKLGIPFSISTKGDARFLLKLPSFIDYKFKFVAITIKRTADILSAISPGALPFHHRLEVVKGLSSLGADTIIRLDPIFIHLFQAVHRQACPDRLEGLMNSFSVSEAKHIIASTGRLSRRQLSNGQLSSWDKIIRVVRAFSEQATKQMIREYVFKNN